MNRDLHTPSAASSNFAARRRSLIASLSRMHEALDAIERSAIQSEDLDVDDYEACKKSFRAVGTDVIAYQERLEELRSSTQSAGGTR